MVLSAAYMRLKRGRTGGTHGTLSQDGECHPVAADCRVTNCAFYMLWQTSYDVPHTVKPAGSAAVFHARMEPAPQPGQRWACWVAAHSLRDALRRTIEQQRIRVYVDVQARCGPASLHLLRAPTLTRAAGI